jgi:hypothetical protein
MPVETSTSIEQAAAWAVDEKIKAEMDAESKAGKVLFLNNMVIFPKKVNNKNDIYQSTCFAAWFNRLQVYN